MVIVAAVYHVFSMPIVRAVPAHYDRPGMAAEGCPIVSSELTIHIRFVLCLHTSKQLYIPKLGVCFVPLIMPAAKHRRGGGARYMQHMPTWSRSFAWVGLTV